MMPNRDISLPLFVVMWNQLQSQTTPAIHMRMAHWLEHQKDTLRLLMAFRGAGKSSVVGLYAAWLLYKNNNARIMVLAADDALAKKMVRQVKRIIERHPATKNMRPRFADQWASDRFTINRDQELRDPSMLAKGVEANITGCRADVIICDDVEVPGNCDTADKRKELREKLLELSYILTPNGQMLYVGTPHHVDSIYQENNDDIKGEEAFLIRATRLKIRLINKAGHSAWPERFSRSSIDELKRRTGPLKFASQMMLEPVSLDQSRLDAGQLQFEETPDERHITQKVASWDPAFGAQNGDGSIMAIVYALYDGRFYIADIQSVATGYVDQSNADNDIAQSQCLRIVHLLKRFSLKRLLLENNGIGKFLPSIMRRVLRQERYSCAVIEVAQKTNKAERILSVFDPLLAARSLVCAPHLKASKFITELQEFVPTKNSNRDDYLDAVATALLNLNITFHKGG